MTWSKKIARIFHIDATGRQILRLAELGVGFSTKDMNGIGCFLYSFTHTLICVNVSKKVIRWVFIKYASMVLIMIASWIMKYYKFVPDKMVEERDRPAKQWTNTLPPDCNALQNQTLLYHAAGHDLSKTYPSMNSKVAWKWSWIGVSDESWMSSFKYWKSSGNL